MLYAEHELPHIDAMAKDFAKALEDAGDSVEIHKIDGCDHNFILFRLDQPGRPDGLGAAQLPRQARRGAEAVSTAGAVGRLAPSPTGSQHVGNARTYLLAWLSARSKGGRVVLRIEDVDSPRVKPGAAAEACDDLRWLGLDWDDGPLIQTRRLPFYETRSANTAKARTRLSMHLYAHRRGARRQRPARGA